MNPAKTNVPTAYDKMAVALQKAHEARTNNVEFYGRISDDVLKTIPGHNECHPGIRMVEYNLIIATPETPDRTRGGVFITQDSRDNQEMATQVGRIIDASPVAFNYDNFYTQFPDMAPKVGDLVWIARYAGGEAVGKDGRRYRIIKDKDVGGVIDPPTDIPSAA